MMSHAGLGDLSSHLRAMYSATGGSGGQLIAFGQGKSSRGPCLGLFGPPGGKIIARVRVAGERAILTRGHARLCLRSRNGKPICKSATVILRLSWTKHGHFCRITGLRERRASIIGFARHLVVVK